MTITNSPYPSPAGTATPEPTHYPWPKTEQFRHVRGRVLRMDWPQGPGGKTQYYRAKVKLHGTNAAVQVYPDGAVVAQSRKRIITPVQDNMGFAAWVHAHADEWRKMTASALSSCWSLNGGLPTPVTIYGEWFGPGIQKGVACNKVPAKQFAVFAMVLDHYLALYNPSDLRSLLEPLDIDRLHVLPWYGDRVAIPFGDHAESTAVAGQLLEQVLQVEACDPFIMETFGIEGIGEGLVLYPNPYTGSCSLNNLGRMMFKVKGEKHVDASKETKRPAVDIEKLRSVQEFVSSLVTEARLQQGVSELFGDTSPTRKDTGTFLRWVAEDVQAESVQEMAENGLTWKQVGKPVGAKARQWFFAHIDSIGV